MTRLWDKHAPLWRKQAAQKEPLDKVRDAKIIEELSRIREAVKSSDPNERLSLEDAQFMQISRDVLRKKGKWKRFSDDV